VAVAAGRGGQGGSRGGGKAQGMRKAGGSRSQRPACRVASIIRGMVAGPCVAVLQSPFAGCCPMPALPAVAPEATWRRLSDTRKPRPKPGLFGDDPLSTR
jgi:hypothetical protein